MKRISDPAIIGRLAKLDYIGQADTKSVIKWLNEKYGIKFVLDVTKDACYDAFFTKYKKIPKQMPERYTNASEHYYINSYYSKPNEDDIIMSSLADVLKWVFNNLK